MPIDKQRFQEIQKRAKAIIDRDIRGELDEYAKNVNATMINEGELSFDVPQYASTQTQNVPKNSKLPKAILESFSNNPIEIPEYNGSILDDIGVPYEQQPTKKTIARQQVIRESTPNVTTANVDYSLIKTIVEDCVKRGMASLKKSMITENTSNTNNQLALLKIGESFKFVTSNGDIYEAKLIKKGNVNEKKKAMQLQENNR